jgi:hypothetical protein
MSKNRFNKYLFITYHAMARHENLMAFGAIYYPSLKKHPNVSKRGKNKPAPPSEAQAHISYKRIYFWAGGFPARGASAGAPLD